MEKAFQYLAENDSVFQHIINTYGLPEIIPSRPEGFETLVLLILEQQVSIDSAKATFLRIRESVIEIKPENLVHLTEEEFRAFGVSRQKAKYIKCLAEAVLDNSIDLASLSSKPSDHVREELIQLKGIGNWTIDIYLMFCLKKEDVLPLGDVAVVNTMKELLDIHDKTEMDTYAERWSPYKTYAAFLLWHYYLQKRGRKITYQY
ncbi:DNA-3-methyladenine glycosylase 2 family protein [Flavobacterium amniphilum]|uniref:DNA-3-methyladenine glycosylase family protein n=1 Tax=Flavobacterium amniphilum TaxID=1834035 RepID=UPI00202A44C0|nr:DNA-3-methyladenine glycosylase 2 family protein [Flavobacterium amniphilum]MCL9806758.1 DNA-3-methyladenine glycosylase 2 family protein [Flavobacterium amniphilum]